jgi:hypothetical protein
MAASQLLWSEIIKEVCEAPNCVGDVRPCADREVV